MPRGKKKDLGEIVARAQQLRADINALREDMREITHRLVLSVLTRETMKKGKHQKVKRRRRPPKARKRGRPPKALGKKAI